jgi:hypothetical protein
MEKHSAPLPSRRSTDSTLAGGTPLQLVDPDFDAQLLAERDRLSALYDRRLTYLRDARETADVEHSDAIECAMFIGGMVVSFIVGMFVGALLLASAAWLIDSVRGWVS